MRDGEIVNGLKEGLWVSYYANGAKQSEGHYAKGVKEGLWMQYHSNGNKKSEGSFVGGKFVGLYTSFHANGKRLRQGRYNEGTGTSADGTKEGAWYDYAEDGETPTRRITYHHGSRARPDEYPPFDAKSDSE